MEANGDVSFGTAPQPSNYTDTGRVQADTSLNSNNETDQ